MNSAIVYFFSAPAEGLEGVAEGVAAAVLLGTAEASTTDVGAAAAEELARAELAGAELTVGVADAALEAGLVAVAGAPVAAGAPLMLPKVRSWGVASVPPSIRAGPGAG